MSASVVVELDTTPPVATWGVPEGTAGSLLRVPYAVDEPTALDASVTDVAGQTFELDLGPELLQGTLTGAVPGLARVDLHVRDDVLNETVRSLSFTLQAPPETEGRADVHVDSMRAEAVLDAMTAALRVDPLTGELTLDRMDADVELED